MKLSTLKRYIDGHGWRIGYAHCCSQFFGNDRVKIECLQAGANEVHNKPISKETIEQIGDKVFKGVHQTHTCPLNDY